MLQGPVGHVPPGDAPILPRGGDGKTAEYRDPSSSNDLSRKLKIPLLLAQYVPPPPSAALLPPPSAAGLSGVMHVTHNTHLSHRCADTQLNISRQSTSVSAQLFDLEHTTLSISAAPVFVGLLHLEHVKHQESGKRLSAHPF